MSQTIRKYIGLNDEHNMYVTAMVGPKFSIYTQLTIYNPDKGYTYIQLSEKQIRDLIKILQDRLDDKCVATDDKCQPYPVIDINGNIIDTEID